MSDIPRGAIRFNTDSNKPELWDGSQWAEFQLSTPNLGRSVDTQPGARGVYGGGFVVPTVTSVSLEYLNISSTGDATSFGDLTGTHRAWISSCASQTRGMWGAGSDYPGNNTENTIDFITIASTGDATNFGDLIDSYKGFAIASCSNSTRGLWGSGYTAPGGPNLNTIQYVTIASTGNAVNYGDLTQARRGAAACGSATKGLFGGGIISSSVNTIDFITISTTGDAQDFGDLTFPTRRDGNGSCSNPIRGLWAGGYNPGVSSEIDTVIITSRGNAVKFGELSQGRASLGAFSSPIRAVFLGAINSLANHGDIIDYVQFTTEGNAVDFGDLTAKKGGASGCSNAHGGL